jgi:hypothetical protein
MISGNVSQDAVAVGRDVEEARTAGRPAEQRQIAYRLLRFPEAGVPVGNRCGDPHDQRMQPTIGRWICCGRIETNWYPRRRFPIEWRRPAAGRCSAAQRLAWLRDHLRITIQSGGDPMRGGPIRFRENHIEDHHGDAGGIQPVQHVGQHLTRPRPLAVAQQAAVIDIDDEDIAGDRCRCRLGYEDIVQLAGGALHEAWLKQAGQGQTNGPRIPTAAIWFCFPDRSSRWRRA